MTDKEKAILEKWAKVLPRLTDLQKEKALAAADALVLMTEYVPHDTTPDPPAKHTA